MIVLMLLYTKSTDPLLLLRISYLILYTITHLFHSNIITDLLLHKHFFLSNLLESDPTTI